MGIVQSENSNSCFTHIRAGDDTFGLHPEVFSPYVDARIEKPHQLLAYETGNVASFGPIAEWAAESKIVLRSGSIVFFTDDVIDMKGVNAVGLVQEAVFANRSRALPDRFAKRGRNPGATHAATWASRARARAFAIVSTLSTSIARSNSSRSSVSKPSDFSFSMSHSKRALASQEGRNATNSCGVMPCDRNSIAS